MIRRVGVSGRESLTHVSCETRVKIPALAFAKNAKLRVGHPEKSYSVSVMKHISAHSPRNLACLIFIPSFFISSQSNPSPNRETTRQIKTRPAKAARNVPRLDSNYATPLNPIQSNNVKTTVRVP
jgi:hypothetical protein